MDRNRHPRQRSGSSRRGAFVCAAASTVVAILSAVAMDGAPAQDPISVVMLTFSILATMGGLIAACLGDD